jgi:hypothetical protein
VVLVVTAELLLLFGLIRQLLQLAVTVEQLVLLVLVVTVRLETVGVQVVAVVAVVLVLVRLVDKVVTAE